MDDERTGDTHGKAVQVYFSSIIVMKTAIMYKGGLLFVLGINGRVAPYHDEDQQQMDDFVSGVHGISHGNLIILRKASLYFTRRRKSSIFL
jgi:hypothetical protein